MRERERERERKRERVFEIFQPLQTANKAYINDFQANVKPRTVGSREAVHKNKTEGVKIKLFLQTSERSKVLPENLYSHIKVPLKRKRKTAFLYSQPF